MRWSPAFSGPSVDKWDAVGYGGAKWGRVPRRRTADAGYGVAVGIRREDSGEARCTLFVGQYEHTLDDKGRVVLPPDFREQLGSVGYVVKMGERLGVWSEAGYQDVSDGWINHRQRGVIDGVTFRKLTAETHRARIDSAGRITINKNLLDDFRLGEPVVLSGALNRVEIWPRDLFHQIHGTEQANANVSAALERMGL